MHPRKNASLPSPVRSMVPPPPPSFYVCFYWEKSATYSSFFKYSHNVFLRGISHSCKIGGIIQFTPYFILCTGCGRTIALPCRKNNGSRGQKLSSGDKNYPPGTKIILRGQKLSSGDPGRPRVKIHPFLARSEPYEVIF